MTLKQSSEIVDRCIRHIDFAQAEECLTYLRLSGDRWGEGLEVPWIFRGHGNADWELLSRAWRPGIFDNLMPDLLARLRPYAEEGWTRMRDEAFGSGFGSLRPYINGLDESIIDERAVSVRIQRALENEALREFFRLGDELGYPVGDSPYNQPPERIAHSSSLSEFQIPEVAGLAQHHGIPTRLLDWTRKPEIAAFFAAESALFE